MTDKKQSYFFTGDGICPVCGKMIIGDKPLTHHSHKIGLAKHLLFKQWQAAVLRGDSQTAIQMLKFAGLWKESPSEGGYAKR